MLREELLRDRQVVRPERARPADDVLPEPRLRLVQAERRRVGDGGAGVHRRHALLVQPVARTRASTTAARPARASRSTASSCARPAGRGRRRTGASRCPGAPPRSRSRSRAAAAASAAPGAPCRTGRPGTTCRASAGRAPAATNGTSSARRPSSSGSSSATVMPGSYASSSASYRSPPSASASACWILSASIASSSGCQTEKSFACARLLPRLVGARRLLAQGAHELGGQLHAAVAVVLREAHHRALGLGQLGAVGGQRLDRVAVDRVDRALVRRASRAWPSAARARARPLREQYVCSSHTRSAPQPRGHRPRASGARTCPSAGAPVMQLTPLDSYCRGQEVSARLRDPTIPEWPAATGCS